MPKQKTHIAMPIHEEEPEKAFDAMLLRNKAMLWHICSDFNLGTTWSTEDCMQEVIYILWRDFSQFEGRSSERTWVYRVATNAMLMLKRKQLHSLTCEPQGVYDDSSAFGWVFLQRNRRHDRKHSWCSGHAHRTHQTKAQTTL